MKFSGGDELGVDGPFGTVPVPGAPALPRQQAPSMPCAGHGHPGLPAQAGKSTGGGLAMSETVVALNNLTLQRQHRSSGRERASTATTPDMLIHSGPLSPQPSGQNAEGQPRGLLHQPEARTMTIMPGAPSRAHAMLVKRFTTLHSGSHSRGSPSKRPLPTTLPLYQDCVLNQQPAGQISISKRVSGSESPDDLGWPLVCPPHTTANLTKAVDMSHASQEPHMRRQVLAMPAAAATGDARAIEHVESSVRLPVPRSKQEQAILRPSTISHSMSAASRGEDGTGLDGSSLSTSSSLVSQTESLEEVIAPQYAESAEQILGQFMERYAMQEEQENIAEYLKEQLLRAHGAVGTLDVEVCLDVVDRNDVTLVITDTGTGKSTLIPKGLLERHPEAMIVNCQPRRTSTINLAQRVAQLLGEEKLGETVGYSVRGERVGVLGETRLMYVTNYTLLLSLLWHKPQEIPFTHIIFDEFHERSLEVELQLALLKLVLHRFPKKFKIVLCSATAQAEEWISFFDNMMVGEYNQANPMFPVHTYFMEGICKLVGAKCTPFVVSPDNTVDSLHLHSILGVIKQTLCFLAHVMDPRHSILLFLPGRTNVEEFAKWIHSKLNNELDPIMWYGGVDLARIQEALQRESTTKKKVYLATDIAEVGLTLPDVVFVIDCGMCKRPLVSEQNPYSVAFPPLRLLWEGALNARQRCGRIGRVQQGFYFCMLFSKHFNRLSAVDSQIRNSVINELVLLTLQLANTPFATFELCHEQPRPVSIQHSLSTLQDGGFIIAQSHRLSAKEAVQGKKEGADGGLAACSAWRELIDEIKAEKDQQGVAGSRGGPAAKALGVSEPKGVAEGGLRGLQGFRDRCVPQLVNTPYCVTLKGFFVLHLPMCIEPASTVFYGVMFGIPMLSIIAASVEAVKSPFNTPYNIYDKQEKKDACHDVSNIMSTFKGELKSDIMSSVGALLSYMDMQRSGFSDEAQEHWCTERFLSRIRLSDTLNVIAQMKGQIGVFFPLPEMDDVDELLLQYERYAALLNFICIGTHLQCAAYVRKNFYGKKTHDGVGIFIKMRIERDYFIPSVCPWKPLSVCVPLSLRTSYETLRANFATQVDPAVFNLATLLFSFRVTFRRPDTESKDSGDKESVLYLFQVMSMGVQQTFACDKITGQLIIQLRRIMCAKLCAMQIFIEQEGDKGDFKPIADALRTSGTDFGLPESQLDHPEHISLLLQQGLTKLLERFDDVKGNTVSHRKHIIPGNSDTSTFCSVLEYPLKLAPPAMESLLVHSCNGIFPLSEND